MIETCDGAASLRPPDGASSDAPQGTGDPGAPQSVAPDPGDVTADAGPLARGAALIGREADRLPLSPGVYRMLNAAGEVLYVGKARQLKRRVANYANPAGLSIRIRRMVAETAQLEITLTHTEVEALLLECNLIKRLEPRYNVLLRDDKSFPNILLSGDHAFPRIGKHRGARDDKGRYFGPFASAGAVNRTLTALQRAFLLRTCSDSDFAQRRRPCLQYQIKRCSAPCVGYIGEADYARLVDQAQDFLSGRSRSVQDDLVTRMQAASDALEFERAARFRDRIRALTLIQARQDINVTGVKDADIFAAYEAGGQIGVQVFFYRGGANYGNRAYFPSHDRAMAIEAVMTAFIGQFYDDRPPPPILLTSHLVAEHALLAEALGVKAGRRVAIVAPQRGPKRALVDAALANAREALARRMADGASQARLLEQVATVFGLAGPPERIEVYDNSHIQGTNAIGAMVVAGRDGFMKGAYRKFNIRGTDAPVDAGDDFAMMREVLRRRFSRQMKEDPDRTGPGWPDLVLIDGGQGQLSAARQVMSELGLHALPLVAIAKGPDRNAGRERFFMDGRPAFQLEERDPALYFLQRLRDEAHRFAIGTHRTRRQGASIRSELDEIAGIGAARRKALLHHFGSTRAIARAGLADLERVPGISARVAKKIYEHFHADG